MFHTIKLSKADPTPLYIQLASEIARLIQTGILFGGIKLPPIRTLSKQLSINRDTVVSAYDLLESQGLVEAHIGKGTYVTKSTAHFLASSVSDEADNIYCSTLGFSKQPFSISLCKELALKVIDEEGWNAFGDPLNRERNCLKQSACRFLENLNIKASAAQLRIIKHFPDFLLTLFKHSPKQGICVEEFCDLAYPSYLRSIGAKIYEVPLTKEGLNLESLEKYLRSGNIGYIFLSTYLQNPTGICYSHQNKQKLIELAEIYDCYIVEDGSLNDFLYDLDVPLPLFNYYSKDRVIHLCHFSKIYLPHVSYTFVLLPSDMLKSIPDQITCTFNEYLLRYYLESDFMKENRAWMITSCKEKYQQLYQGLLSLNDKIDIYAASGGIFFWLRPVKKSCEEMNQLFLQNNIIIAPGSLFSYSNRTEYFRLSISNINVNSIDNMLELIQKN